MARPGGNPILQNHRMKSGRKESLNCLLQLKIPQSMKDALEKLDDKNEFVRQAIAAALLHLEE